MKRRTQRVDNKVEVIGIDHGWFGMKTVHEVFTLILSILVDTFFTRISMPKRQHPEIHSISVA